MNCQEFEPFIADIARDHLVDALERDTTLAHLRSCSECARRLRDQRALTDSLRRLSGDRRTLEAPPRVHKALLGAFREQRRLSGCEATAQAPKRSPETAQRYWAMSSAAALILAVLALAMWWSRQTPSPRHTPIENSASLDRDEDKKPNQSPAPIPVSPRPALMPTTSRDQPRNSEYERTNQANQRQGSGKRTVAIEVATDFIPINETNLMPMDAAVVFRVELPRSAMASFGLPMNLERSGNRIKADVVIGNDGLARAIRFVR